MHIVLSFGVSSESNIELRLPTVDVRVLKSSVLQYGQDKSPISC